MNVRKINYTDDTNTSGISKVIAVLLTAIPILAAIGYGAVDTLAMGVLFILAAVIVILWITDGWRSGQFRYSSDPIQLPLLGLIVIAGLQLMPLAGHDATVPSLSVPAARALTFDPYATRLFLIHLFIYLVFFSSALVYLNGAARLKRVGVTIVVFGAGLAFFGILQRLSTPEAIYGLRETPQAISFGPYVNQHHFAALMQMASGIALGLLFGTGAGRERKIFLALAAGIMGMAVMFTGSRGGLIGYLCVVGLSAGASFVRKGRKRRDDDDYYRAERRNRNLLILTAAGGLVVLVLGSVLFLGGQESLLRGVGLQYRQDDISSGRLHFWKIAWQIFLENPILGAGLNGFGMAFTRFDTWNGLYRVEQAHNDYLQMLADAGILGFACVVVFVFFLLKKGIASIGNQTDGVRRSIVTGALAGCIGILIHSFFDFPLRTPANAFFFLLLVALMIANASGERRRRSLKTETGVDE